MHLQPGNASKNEEKPQNQEKRKAVKRESLIRTPNNEVHETLRALQEAGGNRADLQHLRSNPEIARAVIYKIREMVDPVTSVFHQMARDIMGPNFLGVSAAIRYFKIDPTTVEQLEALDKIPFSEEILRKCCDTHILVADFGLAINDIAERVYPGILRHDGWWDYQNFVREFCEPCWCLIRKEPVPKSLNKRWQEQCKLISNNEEIPTARTLIYAIILNYLAKRERMFERCNVRTSSVCDNGDRVGLGIFDHNGIGIYFDWNDAESKHVGLASAWK